MTEWRPIPGTHGDYFASDEGQIRGRRRQGSSGEPLRPWRRDGYGFVNIHSDGTQRLRPVHQLVLEAFVGPKPEGTECRHLDGDPSNNRLDNLTWGTRSENALDRVRHGTHHNVGHTKKACKYGHSFDDANTIVRPDGRWECRECNRRRRRESYHRRNHNPDYFAAKYEPIEDGDTP